MKLLHQKDNRKIKNRKKFLQQDKHGNCSTKFQYTLCIATSMRSDLRNWYRNPLPTSFFQRFQSSTLSSVSYEDNSSNRMLNGVRDAYLQRFVRRVLYRGCCGGFGSSIQRFHFEDCMACLRKRARRRLNMYVGTYV